MALNDYEYEYNGLVFGGGTSYGVSSVEGLNSPDAREEIVENAADHGAFVYGRFTAERRIVIEGDVMGTPGPDFAAKMLAWRTAFKLQAEPLPLKFKLPNEEERRINCVPLKRSYPLDLDYNLGWAKVSLLLAAGDPRIYSETLQQVTRTASASTSNMSNGGTENTFLNATIVGPVTNPRIDNNTTGLIFRTGGLSLTSGQELRIDFQKRTIELWSGGVFVASQYSAVTNTSAFWPLVPGTNDVVYNTTSGGTNNSTFTWRAAWL